MSGRNDKPQHAGERLLLVQVLRGVAALLVLASHAQGVMVQAAAQQGTVLQRWPLPPGGFGVDLFFCISGFIMVVASRPLYGRPGAAADFLRRRALRLVPLYWLATGLAVLALALGRHGLQHTSWSALLASLLFVPYPVYGDAAQPYPVLTLGWSLNYEVFFYALFAVFIALPLRRAVACTVAALAVVVLAGAWISPGLMAWHFWSRPIVLEFGVGCLIGLWWLQRPPVPLPAPRVLACVLGALAWLALDPLGLNLKAEGASTPNDLARVAGWGLPAAALLLAAVGREHAGLNLGGAWQGLGRLGDWSYSLYLMHPFALLAVSKTWQWLKLHELLPWPLLWVVMLVSSLLLAVASYHLIEQPLLRRLRPLRLARRAPAGA